jgi:hypothetical protein
MMFSPLQSRTTTHDFWRDVDGFGFLCGVGKDFLVFPGLHFDSFSHFSSSSVMIALAS